MRRRSCMTFISMHLPDCVEMRIVDRCLPEINLGICPVDASQIAELDTCEELREFEAGLRG